MGAFIRLNDVGFSYPLFASWGEKKRFPYRRANMSYRVLSKVNLNIESGARVAVTGPNGAGKTTLLRLLAGIFHPSSGFLHVQGSVSAFLDAGYGLDPNSTGRANSISRGLVRGLSMRESNKCAQQIAEFADIGQFFDQPTRTYSQGMLSRLIFSICTQWHDGILIIDEGLGMADSSFQERARIRLSQLFTSAEICIISSHSRHTLEGICTEAYVLSHGGLNGPYGLDDTEVQANLL